MKVTQDLRVAISAVSRQNRETTSSWRERRKLNQQAAEALDKKKRGKLSKLTAKLDEIEDHADRVRAELREFGVSKDGEGLYIAHEPTFVKAGGVLPEPEKRQWKPDEVIAKLTAAKTQKAFDAILASYGIDWK